MRLGIDQDLWTEFIVSFHRPCSLSPSPPWDEGKTEKSSTSEGLHLSVSDTKSNPFFHFFYVVTGLRVDVKYDPSFYLSFWALSKAQAQGEDEDWCASAEEAVAVPSLRKGERGGSRPSHR